MINIFLFYIFELFSGIFLCILYRNSCKRKVQTLSDAAFYRV